MSTTTAVTNSTAPTTTQPSAPAAKPGCSCTYDCRLSAASAALKGRCAAPPGLPPVLAPSPSPSRNVGVLAVAGRVPAGAMTPTASTERARPTLITGAAAITDRCRASAAALLRFAVAAPPPASALPPLSTAATTGVAASLGAVEGSAPRCAGTTSSSRGWFGCSSSSYSTHSFESPPDSREDTSMAAADLLNNNHQHILQHRARARCSTAQIRDSAAHKGLPKRTLSVHTRPAPAQARPGPRH